MALEINGKIVKILPAQTGAGKKGNWVKQEFVIETNDQYPKKICCSAWGDKADILKSFNPGDEVKVSFNLESREYNEKWYTDIRAWKIDPVNSNKTDSGKDKKSSSQEEDPFSNNIQGEEEDLPF